MIECEGIKPFKAKFIKATATKRTKKSLVPKGFVALSEPELSILWLTKQKEVIELIGVPYGYVLTSKRACWLSRVGGNSNFDAYGRLVNNNDALHGVFVKKRRKE